MASALPLLEEAVGLLRPTRVLAEHALRVTWLGDALLMAGRIDEAEAHAAEALALAGARGQRGAEGWGLRLQAAVSERRGDAARARAGYRDALARASALGMRPLSAHAHLGLSRVTTGETAREHRATALATYRALGMRMWGPGAAEMVR